LFKDQDNWDKDLSSKDKDQDKDCILVLKESLRTRTRTNITVPTWRSREAIFDIEQRVRVVRQLECDVVDRFP